MGKNHNAEGQKDGAKSGCGNLELPHSHTKEVLSFGNELKQVHADNAQYLAGFRNAQEQRK